MPILHTHFTAQARTPEGKTHEVSPQIALAKWGPSMRVTIGVHDAVASQMGERGMDIPPPVAGRALLDTGASVTCIDNEAAQKLNLQPIGVASISSASHSATRMNVYPVCMHLVETNIIISTQNAVGAALGAQGGIVALIGRDIMRDITLFYNGPAGAITLSL